MDTDIIIIGSGPGGYHTAGYAASKGLKVVVVEEAHAGGTCLNCGCIPTKALCHEADKIETVKSFTGEMPAIDFQKIADRKNQVISQLRSAVEGLMQAPGITYIKGHARLKDANTVVVDGTEYQAKNIIIATGSTPKMPPVEGINTPGVMTSTELLDVQQVPQRLCIVGAGVVGMEMASAFNSFGSEVTVVEFLKECLPQLNADIATRLRKALGKRGVNFSMQSAVKAIARQDDALVVTYADKKGKEQQIVADAVLVATGRQANINDLGLEEVGVECYRGGIAVDDNMQTNIPSIFAVGDVNGRMMLAHAATAQGMHCVNYILGKTDNIRLDIMPSAIFTSPEAASVGPSEEQCKAKGINYTLRKALYRSNGKALASEAEEGLVQLLVGEDDKIISCHAYGAHAADIVQEASALMNFGCTVAQLHDIIHTHPTINEVLWSACE